MSCLGPGSGNYNHGGKMTASRLERGMSAMVVLDEMSPGSLGLEWPGAAISPALSPGQEPSELLEGQMCSITVIYLYCGSVYRFRSGLRAPMCGALYTHITRQSLPQRAYTLIWGAFPLLASFHPFLCSVTARLVRALRQLAACIRCVSVHRCSGHIRTYPKGCT